MGVFNSFWEDEKFWAGEMPFYLQYPFNVGLAFSQFLNGILGGDIDESISSRLGRCHLDPGANKIAKRYARPFIDFVFGKDHCVNAMEFNLSRQKEIWHWSSTTDYPVPQDKFKHFPDKIDKV